VLCTESCGCQGCKNQQHHHKQQGSQGIPYQQAIPSQSMGGSPDKSATAARMGGRKGSEVHLPAIDMMGSQPAYPPRAFSERVTVHPEMAQLMSMPMPRPTMPHLAVHPPVHPHVLPPQAATLPPSSPKLSLTREQINTIQSMCLTDVINPTVLRQTCMLMTLLADENLDQLQLKDDTVAQTQDGKVDEILAKQKAAVSKEFEDTLHKIKDTVQTKLDERREKFQVHQNTVR